MCARLAGNTRIVHLSGASRLVAIAAVAVTLAAGPAGAQDGTPEASPEATPLPYADYVTELEKLQAASDAVFERLGSTPTSTEMVEAYLVAVELAAAEQLRLREILPAPCYAAAHEEVLAYRTSIIELSADTLQRMAEAEDWTGFFGIMEEMDAELHARHPTAYLEAPDARPGFGGSHRNILAALATCDVGTSPKPTLPSPEAWVLGEPARLVVVEGAYSLTLPEDWRYMLEGPLADGADDDGARRSPASAPGLSLLGDPRTGEYCEVEYGPNDGTTLEALVAEGRQHPEFELAYVDLPAGRAVRIRGPIGEAGAESELVGYVLIEGPTRVQVWCTGSVVPEDDWLSLVETFEFLPVE